MGLVFSTLLALFFSSGLNVTIVTVTQTFDNPLSNRQSLSSVGWQGYQIADSQSNLPVAVTGNNPPGNRGPMAVAPSNNSLAQPDLRQGYAYAEFDGVVDRRSFFFTTTVPSIDTSALRTVSWIQGNAGTTAQYRVAIRVDDAWYVSERVGADQPFGFSGNEFRQSNGFFYGLNDLDVDWFAFAFIPPGQPNPVMYRPSDAVVALPNGDFTGIGLFFPERNGSATLRFDDFSFTYDDGTSGSGGGPTAAQQQQTRAAAVAAKQAQLQLLRPQQRR